MCDKATCNSICLALYALLVMPSLVNGGVVTWIRFEENGGRIAYDQTGLLDGEFNSFMPTAPGGGDTGFRGWSTNTSSPTIPLTGDANTGSIRFAGGAEYIDLSNYYDLLLGAAFTIEFYIKPDESVELYGANIFGFGSDFSDKLFFDLFIDMDTPYFGAQFMDEQSSISAIDITFNEWQHVALVKGNNQYSVYLDGQLVDAIALPSYLDGPYSFYGDPTLGTRTIGGESGTWRGWLDEFRISDEALLPNQFLIAPEPSTGLLLSLGMLLLAAKRSRR